MTACTGTCVVVVGMVNAGMIVGVAVTIGGIGITGCVVSATNPLSFSPLTRGLSVGAGEAIGFPNIASRSNVFGASTGVGCGSITASGANHPALVFPSSSLIIFISSFRDDASGGFHQTISEDEGIVSMVLDGCASIGCSTISLTSGSITGSTFSGITSGIGSIIGVTISSAFTSTTGSEVAISLVVG